MWTFIVFIANRITGSASTRVFHKSGSTVERKQSFPNIDDCAGRLHNHTTQESIPERLIVIKANGKIDKGIKILQSGGQVKEPPELLHGTILHIHSRLQLKQSQHREGVRSNSVVVASVLHGKESQWNKKVVTCKRMCLEFRVRFQFDRGKWSFPPPPSAGQQSLRSDFQLFAFIYMTGSCYETRHFDRRSRQWSNDSYL